MMRQFRKLMRTEQNTVYKKHNRLLQVVVFVILQFSLVTDLLASNRMYRYKDENGKVVVSSTLPPKYSQGGYEILNDKGIVIQTVAPRKTEEQLRQEALEAERLEAERQAQLEQERLDTILINSYTDISDIERARDSELDSKDRDIMLLKNNIRRYTRLLEDAQARAARDERLGKELSPKLQKEIAQYKRRIAKEEQNVIDIEEDKSIINDRYNSSIIRFSELKAAERLRQYNEDREGTKERHTIYDCTGANACDQAWNASLRFASEYSTTELAWANESTIMMRKPRNDEDISLVLTRVNNKRNNSASIVLEVRCNRTEEGEKFCASPAVVNVKQAFSGYLSAGRSNS